ncbi:MAG: hypothetical protein EAZ81_01260 [Verrucomicrobia bacterium]|jgi:hypothetical protein|nr:MAG: hypothetical protein EAZ81_01260 [Verrucomicrobiota bacterium]
MSLKSFHIVFVTFTFLMSLFFVLWAFVLSVDVTTATKAIGWSGVAGLALVPVYAVYFWKKASRIIL